MVRRYGGPHGIAIFALNRSSTEALDVEIVLRGFGEDLQIVEALELHHPNLKAANTKVAPETVVPRANTDVTVHEGSVSVQLKPLSWNVVVARRA